MTTEILSKFKDQLLAQQEEIKSRLKLQEATQKSAQHLEIGDHGGDATLEALEPLTDSESHLLEKIDFALQRIATGTYGICTGCQKEIPLARLEAKPSVSLCLDCQKKHEHAA